MTEWVRLARQEIPTIDLTHAIGLLLIIYNYYQYDYYNYYYDTIVLTVWALNLTIAHVSGWTQLKDVIE